MLIPGSNLDDLVEKVLGQPNEQGLYSKETLIDNAILTPLNKYVDQVNHHIAEKMPGPGRTYLSADAAIDEETANIIGPEILNTLRPPGLPSHSLNLKPGMVVMLLRNISTSGGLANGTRLLVKACFDNVIQAEILTGEG